MDTDLIKVDPQKERLESEVPAIVLRANNLVVDSSEAYQYGGEQLVDIKTKLSVVNDVYDGLISSAHKHHILLCNEKKKYSAPLLDAEKIVKDKMAMFQTEQERIRQEEERRLREEARKLEEERRLAEAAELEKLGRTEEADQVVSAPIHVPVIVAPVPVAKAEGVSTKKVWKARVVNPNLVPREYLIVDEQKIGQFARMHGENAKLPGVEFYPETIVSARSR